MKSMKQLSLAETAFLPKAGKQTRKAVFLSEMETVVPCSRLEALIEPFYPKKGNGRPPMPLGTMLRIHFMQQRFDHSIQAMVVAQHNIPLPRRFAGLVTFKDFSVITPTKKHAGGKPTDEQKAIKRLLPAIRIIAEHPFLVIKHQFGFTKDRYPGWAMKNRQIMSLFVLANLWLARKRLVSLLGEEGP
jgi:hypothetical protein